MFELACLNTVYNAERDGTELESSSKQPQGSGWKPFLMTGGNNFTHFVWYDFSAASKPLLNLPQYKKFLIMYLNAYNWACFYSWHFNELSISWQGETPVQLKFPFQGLWVLVICLVPITQSPSYLIRMWANQVHFVIIGIGLSFQLQPNELTSWHGTY